MAVEGLLLLGIRINLIYRIVKQQEFPNQIQCNKNQETDVVIIIIIIFNDVVRNQAPLLFSVEWYDRFCELERISEVAVVACFNVLLLPRRSPG
jgi:hypothetical protein